MKKSLWSAAFLEGAQGLVGIVLICTVYFGSRPPNLDVSKSIGTVSLKVNNT